MKITNLTNVDLKSKAFMALASLYFNNGAAILQKASPIANTEKEKYASEKEKALGNFKKSVGLCQSGPQTFSRKYGCKRFGETDQRCYEITDSGIK